MTNTIRLKITCFLLLFTVLLIKGILDLAWHLATRMKFGTCEQNLDLFGTIQGLCSQLGPSPKFGTSLVALINDPTPTHERLQGGMDHESTKSPLGISYFQGLNVS